MNYTAVRPNRSRSTLQSKRVQSYLDNEEVYATIGHHRSKYVQPVVWYSFLALVVVLFRTFRTSITLYQPWRISLVLWLLLVWIYAQCSFKLVDMYLDSLLITNVGLILFRWDWLFKQKVATLQRVSIETVAFEQNSLLDTALWKWDITIRVEDTTFTFKNLAQPAKRVTQLLSWKDKILWRFHYSENETAAELEPDKYEMLVEALWEVVSEYVDKKRWTQQR